MIIPVNKFEEMTKDGIRKEVSEISAGTTFDDFRKFQSFQRRNFKRSESVTAKAWFSPVP